MLSELTLAAVAVLYDLSAGGDSHRTARQGVTPEACACALDKLQVAGLICTDHPKTAPADTVGNYLAGYRIARPYPDISLLEILEATGEHLDCNRPVDEKLYHGSRAAATRLGIINHMTRLYLSEIKLTDL